MFDLPIALGLLVFLVIAQIGLFVCVVWVISPTVLSTTRMDWSDDVPAKNLDPISTFIGENYGSHFQEDNTFAEDRLRKL